MAGGMNLNAAVSAGILLFEALRQRNGGKTCENPLHYRFCAPGWPNRLLLQHLGIFANHAGLCSRRKASGSRPAYGAATLFRFAAPNTLQLPRELSIEAHLKALSTFRWPARRTTWKPIHLSRKRWLPPTACFSGMLTTPRGRCLSAAKACARIITTLAAHRRTALPI